MDLFEETILTSKMVGQDIRDMETELHEITNQKPARTRVKRDNNIKDKFMFER